ncbi:MAG: hypothetical protein M0C28_32190 [Candidatus Moduliflexus flocculans]|nr:hypothetical protein [Candidatus Moduliflexus flocculans]
MEIRIISVKEAFVFKQKAWLWAAVGLAAMLLPAGIRVPSARTEAEKAAVTKVIDDNIAWFKNKNFDLLFGTYTNGPDLHVSARHRLDDPGI